MDQNTTRFISNAKSLEELAQIEENVKRKNALTPEIKNAISHRAADFGRALIAERTGLDLSTLSPAEEKIVIAISKYVSLKKLSGTNANRTLEQIRNRGLLDSAEISVAKPKPTMGYEELAKAGLSDLSYEQIIIDHNDEFSQRALWYARRTLGLPNETEKAPAKAITPVQRRTEILLGWLKDRSISNDGRIPPFTNAEAASVLGMEDMQIYGRAFGNIQSRIDFACYAVGLPPFGLTADMPFAKAWNQGDRDWAFPIQNMQVAAQSRIWRKSDFDRALRKTQELPGQAHISWENEINKNEDKLKSWAFGLQLHEGNETAPEEDAAVSPRRNPDWTRDELILALDLYVRLESKPPTAKISELSALLIAMAQARGLRTSETFRNENGVSMKISNFMRLDPLYQAEGKGGLGQGSQQEEVVWNEFYHDPQKLVAAAHAIRSAPPGLPDNDQEPYATSEETPYWVFVCNPKKWAIDKFLAHNKLLEQSVIQDSWGIRPSDRDKFSPGQLGIVRVGNDNRTLDELDGRPRLQAGIYALCEIESESYPGTGANNGFWVDGKGREPGWPTVKIRYLRTYEENPLTVERLRSETPNISRHLLHGLEAASFSISGEDFRTVISMLGEDLDDVLNAEQPVITNDKLAEMDKKYKNASPEVKERLSRTVERGPIGNEVKRENGYKCQLCDALGLHSLGFLKPTGQHYVEAHHVMPVAKREAGSLSASNVMTLCPNHHRQVHYGGVTVVINVEDFELTIEGVSVSIPRYRGKA